MNSAELRDAERRRAAREGNSTNSAELREAALWQAARDLKNGKMLHTKRLVASARASFQLSLRVCPCSQRRSPGFVSTRPAHRRSATPYPR